MRYDKLINFGENVEKVETLHTAIGNVHLYSHYGKQYRNFSKTIGLYDPVILFLGIWLRKVKSVS
jgi:hypothetical protein